MVRRDQFGTRGAGDGVLRRHANAFWAFARAMLRYRAQVVLTLVLSVVAAVCLGIGLVGTTPVLRAILQGKSNMQVLAGDWNARMERAASLLPPARWLTLAGDVVAKLPTDPFESLAWIMGGLVVLTIVGALATFMQQYLSLTIVNRTITNARRRAFQAVLRAPLRSVVSSGPTDAVARIINDSTQLAGGLNVLLGKTILSASKGVAGFAAAFFLNWRVSAVALLVTPLLYTIIRKLGKRIRRASERALEGQGELLGVATESLQALRVVKAHDAEVYESGRFHRVNKRVFEELNRVRTARAIASPLTETITLIVLCGMTLVVAKAILSQGIEPANFIMAIICLAVAGASFKPLTALVHDIQTSTPAAERLRELILRSPEPGHERGLPALARHRESIRFQDVTVTYPGREQPALRGIDLTIRHGERVAFVGPNGSGKTTALSLVNRMFDPNQGKVLIDGVDIARTKVRSLRAQVGVVTQETVLFRGSIRSNITYGAANVDTSDRAIIDAAKKARAHEFIEKLPQGYDTPVAEQGLSLSGGQRQRIAIARAILRDPAILILDEATSMVDAESEARIAEALAEFSKGRTTLVVAHRLSTVVHSDRIVVFDAGAIVDIGTHAELLQRCSVYQRLAKDQLI
jgi:ABC-type multidrug transport system fused ATPase/permease subunit